RDRRVVRFDYRASGSETVRSRTVEPWGVVSRRGRWYLAGFDRDRNAPRAFRLSRISGAVTAVGKPGAVEVPHDVDLRAMVGFPDEPSEERTAVVRVRQGACEGLRRLARSVREGRDGWDEAELSFSDAERLAGWM